MKKGKGRKGYEERKRYENDMKKLKGKVRKGKEGMGVERS